MISAREILIASHVGPDQHRSVADIVDHQLRELKRTGYIIHRMVQYEYRTMMADRPEANEHELNELGKDGWLLVQMYEAPGRNKWVYIFARQIETAT